MDLLVHHAIKLLFSIFEGNQAAQNLNELCHHNKIFIIKVSSFKISKCACLKFPPKPKAFGAISEPF